MTPISSIASTPIPLSGAAGGLSSSGAAPAGEAAQSFKSLLLESLDQVNAMQVNANEAVEKLATGGDANVPEVLTAVQKADLSFKLMLQIRNKLLAAYQEIKDMRI